MKIKYAYDKMIAEYLSKIKVCDECFATWYCTENRLRNSREPKCYCFDNIKKYLRDYKIKD